MEYIGTPNYLGPLLFGIATFRARILPRWAGGLLAFESLLVPVGALVSRKNAKIWQHGNTKAERLKRDENLRSIRKYTRQEWKKKAGYQVRSLAETAMFRLKTLFGDKLSTRLIESQRTPASIRCTALNKMSHLGMPHAYPVA